MTSLLRSQILEPFYNWLGKKLNLSHNKELEYEFHLTNRMLRMLSESNQTVLRSSTERELLDNVCSVIAEFGGYDSVVIGYLDGQDKNVLVPNAWYPLMKSGNSLPRINLKEKPDNPLNVSINKKETLVIYKSNDENKFSDASLILSSSQFSSVIILPLYYDNKPLGVLTVFSAQESNIKDDEIHFLQELSYDLSYAISGIRIKEERSNTQEKLAEQHWLLRTLIDHMPDLIYVKDKESKFLVANQMVANVMGTIPTNLLGKDDFDFYPEDLARKYFDAEKNVFVSGEPLISMEEPVLLPDSSIKYFSSTKVPFTDKNGNTLGLVGIGRDITEWKITQQELKRINRMLRVLSECNQAILRCQNEDILLKDVCRLIVDFGEYPCAWIGYLDDDGILKPIAQNGSDKCFCEGFENKYLQDREFQELFKGVIKKHQPGIINNLEENIKSQLFLNELKHSSTTSFIMLPLYAEKKPVGTLNINYSGSDQLKSDEIDLLWEMANDLSHGITNLRIKAERQKAEDKLAEQLRLMNIFLDNMPDCMYVKDVNCRFLVVNKAVATVMGTTPDNLIGKNDFDFYPYELARIYYNDEQIILESGEPLLNKEEIRINPDGNLKIILTSKVPFKDKDGKSIGVVGMGRDITEKKKLEMAIEDSAQKLSAVVNGSPIPQFVIDSDHKVLYWNKAMEEISGTKADVVIGTNHHWKPFYKSDRPCLADLLLNNDTDLQKWYIEKVRRSEIIPGAFQCEHFFPEIGIDGKWLYITAAVIKDSTGNYIGAIETLEDITERKRIEIEVIHAKDQAEKSDRLKSEFLAQMSHEIRSPINTIFNFNELLKESLDLKNNPEQQEIFSAIEKAGERIVRTIDLILNMSEVQAGSYKCVFKEINLFNNILTKIFREFQYKAGKKNLQLNLICPDKNIIVIADQYCLEQIIVNLVDNAIKYTQNGKIDIMACRDSYNRTAIKVQDTGIGIAQEYITDLFEPFSQEEQGYTRKFEGSGLGLALVKKYCEMNDADISVESIKGEGSIFTVVFNKVN